MMLKEEEVEESDRNSFGCRDEEDSMERIVRNKGRIEDRGESRGAKTKHNSRFSQRSRCLRLLLIELPDEASVQV